MYGRISEHQFYSFPPKPATQTRHRIGEAGRCFPIVPGLHQEIPMSGFLREIPQPHRRVQPQTQSRRPFGTLAFEGLRFLTAEPLLGVLEGVLNGPGVVVTFQQLGRQTGGIQLVFRKVIGDPAQQFLDCPDFQSEGLPSHIRFFGLL